MTTGPYHVADIDLPSRGGRLPAVCEDCGWRGRAEQTREIGECSLTPGDASPVGRCPECDTLAYLARPKDLMRDCAPRMFELLDEILRGDCVLTRSEDRRRLVDLIDRISPRQR